MLDKPATQTDPCSCRDCPARLSGMCGALGADEIRSLSRHTHATRHPAGTELFGEDTDIAGYANVISGVVKLSKVLEDGRQQVVGLKFPSDFIGRLNAASTTLSAEAASDVVLCKVPRAVLGRLVDANRDLERQITDQALRDLDEAREWLVTLGRKSAAERVASFLFQIALHLAPRAVQSGRVEYDLPLSRADIADFLGLSMETVSRQISVLRRSEVVVIRNKRHVVIPDTARLRALAG